MKRPLVVPAETKRLALERIANGEAVSAIASDLGVHRQRLYDWQTRVRESGLTALRGRGALPSLIVVTVGSCPRAQSR